ncbi:MAG: branched-chain amino acid ABC transporter permease [Oscillospiraceae bacterium]
MSKLLQGIKSRKIKLLLWLVVAVVVALMLRERYLALVLCFICINSIAVTGLDVLFGYTGQVSFGHAGYYALGAYGSTLITMKLGLPVLLSIALGAIIAMVFGIVIAFPASKLVKHFLSLLSIAFGNMVFMFISGAAWLTNGFSGIMNIPKVNLFGFMVDTNQRYFFFSAVVLALVLLCKHRIIKSRVGRAFIAIRENTHAAGGMGINVRRYKVTAFAISAFFTGLAGAMYAHLVRFISPDTFTNTTSNLFMTMLLFGGIASLLGPLVGSTILVLVTEVMQSFASYQMLIYAIFILIVLFFLPNGMVGIVDTLRAKILGIFKRKKVG